MIATLSGILTGVKLKQPENGQEFKPHKLLSVCQTIEGETEVVKVKSMDLEKEFDVNKVLNLQCNFNHWKNGNRSGLSINLVKVV